MHNVKRTLVATALIGSAVLVGLAVGGPLTDQGTQPGLDNPLLPEQNCRNCHANYDAGNDIEPWNTWAGSMMANASRDPLFWAALDVANNDIPGVGDFCLRCHVGRGWLSGRSEPPGGSVDGCGLQGQIDVSGGGNNDFEGVTCHLCHRMHVNPSPPAGEDAVYFENGQYWIDDVDCPGSNEPCRRGPYDYPTDGNPPPHAWAYSDYHESSDLCANCHNVTSPAHNLIDGGVDTGVPFPIERTSREWTLSDFSVPGPGFKTCQNCHMADATANPSNACLQASNDHSGDMPIHQFAGGNAWIPDVLRQEYPNLGLDDELIATRNAALDMLQNQSALVEITVPAVVTEGQSMGVEVKVTNLTGHKLPTGYPEGRRMWLTVEARDGSNQVFWESGAYDSATGVLTKDSQVKVYEIKPGIWDYNGSGACDIADSGGNAIFHFVLNDCIVSDNRIPPLGFTGGNDLETRPVGYTYPETSPGSGILVNHDTTGYSIPVPAGTPGPIRVTSTLRYQTSSKDYIEFLLAEAVDNSFPDDCLERSGGLPGASRGEILYTMWTNSDRSPPVTMGSDLGMTAVQAPTPGEASRSAQMLVTGYDNGTGEVDLSYDPACTAQDHVAYVGDLAGVASLSFSEQNCALGATGSATFSVGSGSYFWVIVGQDGSNEGSYGTDSAGVERPEDASLPTCALPQDLARRCDP